MSANAKYKVGDRVRVLRDGVYHGARGVVEVDDRAAFRPFRLLLDAGQDFGGFNDTHLWAGADDLELIPTLRIEAGKFYRTRDGRKVGPMERSYMHDSQYPFSVDHAFDANEGKAWRKDGTFDPYSQPHPADLIAEWSEPNLADEYGAPDSSATLGDILAAATAVAPATAKFKVGDRVEVNGGAGNGRNIGATFTIDSDEGDYDGEQSWSGKDNPTPYRYKESELRLVAPATSGKPKFKVGDRVRYITKEPAHGAEYTSGEMVILSMARGEHTGDVDLEYIDEPGLVQTASLSDIDLTIATPAIVALIEDGQPRPSIRPFVHASREAAEAEASRLAGKHPGKEFGVYDLVSTKREEPKHEWQKLALAGNETAAVDALVKVSGIDRGAATSAVWSLAA